MSIGVPALTISSAAGICEEILPSGSAGCGEACPSVRFFSRSAFSASSSFRPSMSGTLTLPEPTAIRIATGSPFSALAPSAGVWPMTVPARHLVVDLLLLVRVQLEVGLGQLLLGLERRRPRRPPSGRARSAAGCGRAGTAAARAAASTGISHHGSHGLCANVPWVGSSGPVGALGRPPRRPSIPWPAWRVQGAHLRALRPAAPRICGMRTFRPPGPIVTPGGYSCGLKTRGGYMPGTCGGAARRYHFFFGAGPCCCRTSAPTRLGGGALGGLLAGDRLDLQAALLAAADPDLLGRADLHLRVVTDAARAGSPAAGG